MELNKFLGEELRGKLEARGFGGFDSYENLYLIMSLMVDVVVPQSMVFFL